VTGRPTTRDEKVVDFIIDQVAQGVPLAEVCRSEGMPHRSTFYAWVDGDEALTRRFARAREDGEHMIAADALRIADDTSNDYVETDSGPVLNREHVQRSKLRIETRLKLLAKWNPKAWGEKLEHSGPGGGPVQMQILTAVPEPEGDDAGH
jgi:transposase